MRKVILSVVVALALAGVASALPTLAGGGTFYLNYEVVTTLGYPGTGSQVLRYLDVGTDWMPTGAPGSQVVTMATIADTTLFINGSPGYGNRGYATIAPWTGPTQTTAHSAGILMLANKQLLSVSTGGTTTLNAGPVPSNYWAIGVDSGFTPAGEARGALVYNATNLKTYVETAPGNNVIGSTGTASGTMNAGNGYSSAPAYTALKTSTYTVDGYAVSGVAWVSDGEMYAQQYFGTDLGYAVYKRTDGGGYISKTLADPVAWPSQAGSFYNGTSNCCNTVAVGDTTGDGIPDFYYRSGGGAIYHGQDINNDGDFSDSSEFWASGLTVDGSLTSISLVQGTDGAWALVMFRSWMGPTSGNGWTDIAPPPALTITALDSYGDPIGPITTIPILDPSETSFATPLGAYKGGQPGITFVRTAGAEIPEPATMLLVGTGVLGLAGVLRRRLIG